MADLRRKSRNQRSRSRRNQYAGRPTTVCAENQRVFNNVCVETCPPGTYEEPDKLPLTCSSDTWFNRTATKTRLATKSAARATASAARSMATATANASRSAYNATADFARRQKQAAADRMYQSCKSYVARYEAALAMGQDVTALAPPNSEENAPQVATEVVQQPYVEQQPYIEQQPYEQPVPVAQLRRSRRQARRY